MSPLKVCILGLKCFDQVAGNPVPRYVGGIETQLVVLARWLVRQGCEVSLITYDHGQADEVHFDGVRVIKSYKPEVGLPVLRNLHPRSIKMWQAMRRADADIYLQMGAGLETGQVAFGCRWFLKSRPPFVFCLASDTNFGASLPNGRFAWEPRTYVYGLRRAGWIVAQTERQRLGLEQATDLPSEVVPMAVAPPVRKQLPSVPVNPAGAHVLWIGRITPSKRFEWLLEAARRSPNLRFDVAGAPNRRSEYAMRLEDEASQLPNLRIHGRVSQAQLASLYREASILCCTSELEGFPTTFLEAWSCGIPVVTTFDPDQLVARNALGRVVGTLDELVFNLHDLIQNAAAYRAISSAALEYFAQNHAPERVAERFRSLLERVARARGKYGSEIES